MNVDHHPLITEFPEYRQAIHDLKLSNNHFSNLCAEYEDLDKAIVRVEDGLEFLENLELNEKKKRRLLLKDEIFAMLAVASE
jgi:hypothetical protein